MTVVVSQTPDMLPLRCVLGIPIAASLTETEDEDCVRMSICASCAWVNHAY
jgi:hypothetical protein